MADKPIYKEWIEKAGNDLRTAEILLEEDGPTDTLCFHCQQAVEKYLKAFLTFKKLPFKKIHDLTILGKLVAKQNKDFSDYLDDCKILNAYYIESRYPPEVIYYSQKEAKKSFETAKAIIDFLQPLFQ